MPNEEALHKPISIAVLILCHTDPKLVKRLIRRLTASRNINCYVHVDLKSNLADFFVDSPQAIFSESRFDVTWGGFNAINATNELMQMAVKDGADRIILNQGLDYPIKSNQQIVNFFADHVKDQFVTSCKITGTEIASLRQKVTVDWNMDKQSIWSRIHRKFALLANFEKHKDFAIVEKKQIDIFYGSATWAITNSAAKYILNYRNHREFIRYMERVFAPDEEYFQTILQNSKYASDIVGHIAPSSDKLVDMRNLTYYEYPSGVTKVFTEHDYDLLMQSDFLFARKFESSASQALLNKLDSVSEGRQYA